MTSLPGPLWLNVGRVSIEKNLPAFYELDLPGSKVQVGTGPMLETYVNSYPAVTFLGLKQGEELAACYRNADYFVFPSVTDTFGLVMLESIASGVPVAALPSTGPSDILIEGKTGIIRNTLQNSCNDMMQQHWDRDFIRKWALTQSWEACTDEFINNLVPVK
jgi:glycosyltransferase involved in cell wall biosynthesis